MRLIDADKLIKRFKELKGSDTLANMFVRDVIKEISKQPTAHDVDKVVERLEEKILNTSDTQLGISARMAFGEAIKIVKSGGIE